MSRIRALAERGFIPTNDELAQAVSTEHLANLVAERARAAPDQGETDAESSEEDERRLADVAALDRRGGRFH